MGGVLHSVQPLQKQRRSIAETSFLLKPLVQDFGEVLREALESLRKRPTDHFLCVFFMLSSNVRGNGTDTDQENRP